MLTFFRKIIKQYLKNKLKRKIFVYGEKIQPSYCLMILCQMTPIIVFKLALIRILLEEGLQTSELVNIIISILISLYIGPIIYCK